MRSRGTQAKLAMLGAPAPLTSIRKVDRSLHRDGLDRHAVRHQDRLLALDEPE